MALQELLCTKCKVVKPVGQFHKELRNPLRDHKRTQCKTCDLEKNRKYIAANREMVNRKRTAKDREIKRFFPAELFEQRLTEQGGVCAICKAKEAGGRGQFHADHDHQKEKPRGVLCHSCNVGLGHFFDNIELMEAALEYLKKYEEENK